MKTLRTLLVDDERLARVRLRRLLEHDSRIDIVAEARNVKEAIEVLDLLQVDLIFVDIQMPGGSGFELFRHWEGNALVIFVTAYDSSAVRAFEVNAIDYLVKPVHSERLSKTLDRAQERFHRRELKRHSARRDQISLQTRDGLRLVPIDEIVSIHAADDYTEVVDTRGRTELSSTPLSTWEARLKERGFCRIHRQSLINLRHLQELERLAGGWQVQLSALSTPLRVGRRRLAHLRASLQSLAIEGS